MENIASALVTQCFWIEVEIGPTRIQYFWCVRFVLVNVEVQNEESPKPLRFKSLPVGGIGLENHAKTREITMLTIW